jgi:hypothetical protein
MLHFPFSYYSVSLRSAVILSSLLRLNLPSGLSLPFRYSVAECLVELEQKPPYAEQNETRNVNGHDVLRHINTKAWEKSVIFIDE